MPKNTPSDNEWQDLYEAAIQVKAIEPWAWMGEMDIFGVQNPENDGIGFVSIMGNLGEHLAIGVYLGPKALYQFWALEQSSPTEIPDRLLEIAQLQASFEDRNQLQKKDRDIIKRLGIKFRGRQAWPMFRSYWPGYFPWHLDAAEARFLTHILHQTRHVALRFKENPDLLVPPDDETYLVRTPRPTKDGMKWQDKLVRVSPPEPESINLVMDHHLLNFLNQAPRVKETVEVDLFMLPTPIQDKSERPFFGYNMLLVEAKSGMVLGTEILAPEPSLEAMWGRVPLKFAEQLAKLGAVPHKIQLKSSLLGQLLQPMADELGFQIKQVAWLPSLDSARNELFRFLG